MSRLTSMSLVTPCITFGGDIVTKTDGKRKFHPLALGAKFLGYPAALAALVVQVVWNIFNSTVLNVFRGIGIAGHKVASLWHGQPKAETKKEQAPAPAPATAATGTTDAAPAPAAEASKKDQ